MMSWVANRRSVTVHHIRDHIRVRGTRVRRPAPTVPSRSKEASMRGIRVALVLVAVALIGAGSAAAANYAQETLDRYFRIEFEVTSASPRPVISGYIYNMNRGLPADRVFRPALRWRIWSTRLIVTSVMRAAAWRGRKYNGWFRGLPYFFSSGSGWSCVVESPAFRGGARALSFNVGSDAQSRGVLYGDRLPRCVRSRGYAGC